MEPIERRVCLKKYLIKSGISCHKKALNIYTLHHILEHILNLSFRWNTIKYKFYTPQNIYRMKFYADHSSFRTVLSRLILGLDLDFILKMCQISPRFAIAPIPLPSHIQYLMPCVTHLTRMVSNLIFGVCSG